MLGDRDGASAMTVRRIAAELDCDPMALYRHFPNRVALLDAVADLAVAEVELPPAGLPWDERLPAVLVAARAAALAHPGIAPHVASRPPLGPNGQRIGGVLVDALGQAGLPPDVVVAASQILVAYLSSSIAMAVAAGGERDERWSEGAHAMRSVSADALPAERMPAVGSDEQFAFGLDLLVAGLRTRT